MSDLLIKGIKIPKNCYDCQLNKSCDARWFLEIDRRPDDCPLVDVPSTKQEQNWIPCSERLPSDDEEVIVSILDDSGDTSFSYTTLGWHYKGIWIVDNSRCPMVIAWMPLPEPYQENAIS